MIRLISLLPSPLSLLRLRALIAYLFLWFSAIILIVIEKSSGFVLFNAWQCLFLVLCFIPFWIIAFAVDVFAIPLGFHVIGFIVWCIFITIWGLCIIQVFRLGPATVFKLPLIGDLAYRQASKKFPVTS